MKREVKKTYLGDSVYADSDGYDVILTTENGYGPSNTIGLEPEVIESLFMYLERLWNIKITSAPLVPEEDKK